MLDRPNTREGWTARAAALKIEGRAFIDGAYVPALDGAVFARISPIDGKVFAHVADCGAADVDRAVKAARAAFESGVWRDADPQAKKTVLLRFAELIRDNVEELALLETLDVGKVIANTPERSTSPSAPTASSTTPSSPTSSTTRSRRWARTTSRWCARSRSASSARSCRGTIR